MKHFHPLLVAALVCTLGASVASAESWKRIITREAFVTAMQGKVFSWGGTGTATLKGDGTTRGKLPNGQAYAGNWIWDQKRYCRNITLANGTQTGTDCGRIDIAGDKIRIKFKDRETILTPK